MEVSMKDYIVCFLIAAGLALALDYWWFFSL
jgi:hypothetical protein